ncbi:MAG: glycosyl transferase [Pseudomonadota bacterium]
MADFQQNGLFATLHRLGQPDRPALEAELLTLAQARPLGLVLPVLASDLQGPAFAPMLEELAGAAYLGQVVLSLGRAGKKDLQAARRLLAVLPQTTRIMHNEGRGLQRLLGEMERAGLGVGQEGKGRAVWLALGLLLAGGQSRVAAVHDCDIVDYDRLLLGRLVYPLLNPRLGHALAKGYYPRFTHRLYGRVTRLFVAPLLAALEVLLGPLPLLGFLRAFRYPLAGEVALDLELVQDWGFSADWGLEIATLAQAWRRLAPRQVCQVDLAESYEHKHQGLSQEDPHKGLLRMTVDITLCLLGELAQAGAQFSPGLARSLCAAYLRLAGQFQEAHAADAAINGLDYDWQDESRDVHAFSHGLARGLEQFLSDDYQPAHLSPWRQVLAVIPDCGQRLLRAVEADNP